MFTLICQTVDRGADLTNMLAFVAHFASVLGFSGKEKIDMLKGKTIGNTDSGDGGTSVTIVYTDPKSKKVIDNIVKILSPPFLEGRDLTDNESLQFNKLMKGE